MLSTSTFSFKAIATVTLVSMLTVMMPVQAFAQDIEAIGKRLNSAPKLEPSRALTATETQKLRGKTSAYNPYLAGNSKFSVMVDGVDITTGNLMLSGTDLSFEGGYGIPVNVTRTYSSNNGDEGPLGIGWTLSVDLRTTAGGVLKSGGGPVRQVPVSLKERPSTQVENTSVANEPVNAMIATDASGEDTTLQRDVDGVILPPGWDGNRIDTTYEWVQVGTRYFEVAVAQKITTPEGTVYQYSKHGEYVRQDGSNYVAGGLHDFRDGSPSGDDYEVSNVLKVDTVTDRHGNVTEYLYSNDTDRVLFQKRNGLVREHKLLTVRMPNQQKFDFVWTGNRITAVKDGNQSTDRTVSYTYENGQLKTVTNPSGLTTTFGYVAPYLQSSGELVLTSVTDPVGLTTTYQSAVVYGTTQFGAPVGKSIATYAIQHPTGMQKYIHYWTNESAVSAIPAQNHQNIASPRVATSSTPRVIGPGAWVAASNINAPASSQEHDNPPPNQTALPRTYQWNFSVAHGNLSNTITGYREDPPATIDIAPYLTQTQSVMAYGGRRADNLEVFGGTNPNQGLIQEMVRKTFSLETQNLVASLQRSHSFNSNIGDPRFAAVSSPVHVSETNTWYNFQGNPLLSRSQNYSSTGQQGGNTLHTPVFTETAYWGRDKYFQQKAIKGPYQEGVTTAANMRLSFTDYYPSTAAAGKRGQTRAIYRSALDTAKDQQNRFVTPGISGTARTLTANDEPNMTDPLDYEWKKRITVTGLNSSNPQYGTDAVPSARFDYDSLGRPTQVEKLQKFTNNTPNYTKTVTEYNGAHGNANKVTEAHGSSDARVTETLAFDSVGRAIHTRDANGREVQTSYLKDGRVSMVTAELNQTVVNTYETGTGRLQRVADDIQGTSQDIIYFSSTDANLGNRGQVATITTESFDDKYTLAYTYNAIGMRTAVDKTADGQRSRKILYRNFVLVGGPGNQQPVFTTLREEELNSSGVPNVISQDEVHTYFSVDGMLIQSAFAQSPQLTSAVNGSFYGFDPAQQAEKRVLATYTYRLDNQLASLGYKWQVQGQTDQEITTASYSYNANQFHLRSGMELDAHPTNYPTGYNYTESYTYHPTLDYLTGVDYSDGTTWDKTWTYDVVGNRNDSTVDMLNRQLSSPGFTYSHDAVGNRTYKKINNVNRFGYTWDQFNRLDAYAELNYQSGGVTMVGAGVANYDYLPNGLRSTKLIDSNIDLEELDANGNPILSGYYDENTLQNDSTTRYRYDGQMTMEEDVTYASGGGTVVDETRYLMGARGIERLEAQRMASPSQNDPLRVAKRSYPLYDGHGNMIATLGRTATGYTVANEKKYDVWGAVRQSQSPGSHVVNPNKQYCANLGHTFDGESDLIYMRARYYEPSTGRFISEDPARDGLNWYGYGNNCPVSQHDLDGRISSDNVPNSSMRLFNLFGGVLVAIATIVVNARDNSKLVSRIAIAQLGFLIGWFGFVHDRSNPSQSNLFERVLGGALTYGIIELIVHSTNPMVKRAEISSTGQLTALVLNHMAFLFTFMTMNEIAEDNGW